MAAVLMIVTSADRMPNGEATGLWLEEFAVPWRALRDIGHDVTVASPQGGAAPIDPRSEDDAVQHPEWRDTAEALRSTQALAGLRADDFAAVFISGGHGTMFDFPDNAVLGALLKAFHAQRKPIAAVCHGPAVFVGVRLDDGAPLITGRLLTAFSDDEERAVGLDGVVPFLLSSRLHALGATVENGDKFKQHVRQDGTLITGQNPQSSAATARLLVEALAIRA